MNILSELNHYVKIHFAVVIIVAISITLLSVWLLPHEKQEQKLISEKNYALVQQYDESSKDYRDPDTANKLRNEITEIKSESILPMLIKVAAVSFFVGVIIVLLANFLQYAFTKIKFVSTVMVSNEPYRVLSMIFFCSTLIVLVVFISTLLE